MIPTIIWTTEKYILKGQDYSISYLKGYKTTGCQCNRDCSCSEEDFGEYVEVYRVSGRTRRIHIEKPFDFKTLEEAKKRINELKQN